jgi:hypothetical protein
VAQEQRGVVATQEQGVWKEVRAIIVIVGAGAVAVGQIIMVVGGVDLVRCCKASEQVGVMAVALGTGGGAGWWLWLQGAGCCKGGGPVGGRGCHCG